MHRITRVAVAVVIVGQFGVNLFASGPALGSVPSPMPTAAIASAAPSASPIDTAAWTTYVSDRYGFSISHPADWTERPADHTWTLADDWLSSASEGFKAPGESILATAWSVAVDPGTTAEAWLAAYCPVTTTPCTGLQDRTTMVTMDRHPGSLVQFADDTEAFVLVDDRMYVVAVWERDSDPRTAPYGGARRLLEGYLSTMHLLPGGPAAPSPSSAPS
jgi:hypothetical protein